MMYITMHDFFVQLGFFNLLKKTFNFFNFQEAVYIFSNFYYFQNSFV